MATIDDFGLLDSGFVMPTSAQLLDIIQSEFKQKLPDIDLSTGSVYDIQTQIFNDIAYRIFQNQENQYYQSRPEYATGNNADSIFGIVDIERIPSAPSYVDCILTGDNTTIIDVNTQISNPATNDIFINEAEGIISTSTCVKAQLEITNVVNNTVYTIAISGITVSYTSDSNATISEIIAGLISVINNYGILGVTASSTDNVTLNVVANNLLTPFAIAYSSNIDVGKVSSLVTFKSVENGAININANTVTKIITLIPGLDSVYNPFDGQIGRITETTQDFRNRFFRIGRFNRSFATTNAIVNAFNNPDLISGISYIKVKRNNTDTTAPDGQIAHSVCAIVEGGSDTDVANLIWEAKGDGIETYGNTSITIQDANGDDQVVQFSRPVKKYIWINAALTQGGDFIIPTNYSDMVTAQIMLFCANISIGDDVLPIQLSGVIALQTKGVSNVAITVAETNEPGNTPIYSGNIISIADDEIAVFDKSRINVSI